MYSPQNRVMYTYMYTYMYLYVHNDYNAHNYSGLPAYTDTSSPTCSDTLQQQSPGQGNIHMDSACTLKGILSCTQYTTQCQLIHTHVSVHITVSD